MKKKMILTAVLVFGLIGCATLKGDWENTQKINTIESYQEFLQSHPHSKFDDEAKASIEQLEWMDTRRKDTVESYQKFLQTHQQSMFDSDAKIRIMHLEWEEAQQRNTVKSYRKFLEKYPQSVFQQEAVVAIENLEWERTRQVDSVEVYQRFLEEYPKSKYTSQATERLEEFDWKKAQKINTLEGYQEFLKQHPQSEFFDAARLEIKNISWDAYERTFPKTIQNFSGKIYDNLFYYKGEGELTDKEIRLKLRFTNKRKGKEKWVLHFNCSNLKLVDQRGNTYPCTYSSFAKNEDTAKKISYNQRIKGVFYFSLPTKFTENLGSELKFYEGKDVLFIIHMKDHPIIAEEKASQEEQVFAECQKQRTIECYDQFISKFPDSLLVKEAIIQERKLYKAQNTLDGYDDFLRKFPESALRQQVIALELAIYEERNTLEGYDQFLEKLSQFPFSLTSDLKEKAIAKVFEIYQSQNTLADYDEFLRKYPHSKYVERAKDAIFQLTLKQEDAKSLYLLGGKYEREGNRKDAKRVYEYIVDEFPTNDLAIKASDRLLSLTEEKPQQQDNTTSENIYSTFPYVGSCVKLRNTGGNTIEGVVKEKKKMGGDIMAYVKFKLIIGTLSGGVNINNVHYKKYDSGWFPEYYWESCD